MKKFLNVLFLSLIMALALAAGGVTQPVVECTGNYAWQVLDEVNHYREDYGLPPLVLSDELCDDADVRARELITEFSHTRPDGTSCFSVIRGKYRHVAENIAAGHESAAETVEQWMNSPGHRANILDSDLKELGVGYCYAEDSDYHHYWVQIFRTR